MTLGSAATAWMVLLGAALAAQDKGPVVEARVRAFARQARTESRGDSTELVLALDQRVRETWGEFESFPLSIVRREDLLVTLSAPYMSYRKSVVDLLRTQRRIEDASWVDAAVFSVSPIRLGAPDIVTLTVSRSGREIPSLKSTLRPMKFESGSGEGVINSGEVHFPMSAFAPGGDVVMTARLKTGDPIVYRFRDTELASLK